MEDEARSEERPDTRVGTVLEGRYQIIRKLGEGGMGAVYEAHHMRVGKTVAIKCLHPHLATDSGVVSRFQREAQAASLARNEHIVDVLDRGTFPDGAPYLVMELLVGRDLSQLIKEAGPLPIGRAIHIVRQACNGLLAVHAKGIVHRDLKPGNVFLVQTRSDPDFVKLLDFGISKLNESHESVHGGLTKTGAPIGTPY